MPNLPIRGLGSIVVVTDVDPYNLPINAFTRAKNVRFTEGKVTRAPYFVGYPQTYRLPPSSPTASWHWQDMIRYWWWMTP